MRDNPAMPGLRIGIDVGGTFTHGVVLRPPGEVVAKAVTPTTHTGSTGVAQGVAEVLRLLLLEIDRLGLDRTEIELVAHSTTQATNALLEGDVAGVHLLALAPAGEHALVRRELGARLLEVGNGHAIRIWPKLLHDWKTATAEHFPAAPSTAAEGHTEASDAAAERLATVPEPTDWHKPGWDGRNVPPGFKVSAVLPVAVVQPLAGKFELREANVAAHYRAWGHGTVCASEITQVLGLQARARTAIVNAAMLPRMLSTADFTERAVSQLLPGVPLQVVRGDGGAMSLDELRRQPVHSLLSGPAAGASAALHRSGLANAVFIEVGGTSTDITLIQHGRVRHRYATVGGQRLLVPALDLRTVAVGGGSMLRQGGRGFGSRSAHIAGLPYTFEAVAAGARLVGSRVWLDGALVDKVEEMPGQGPFAAAATRLTVPLSQVKHSYSVLEFEQNGQPLIAAYTLTDYWLGTLPVTERQEIAESFGQLDDAQWKQLADLTVIAGDAARRTAQLVADSIRELASVHAVELAGYTLLGGGGAAPVVTPLVAELLGFQQTRLIADYPVISAIGAALAVTCVSLSRSVAVPTSQDIAALTQEVETRLQAQGAERVSTDYEFDPQRQVLTVTGRGSRPYDRDAHPRSAAELERLAQEQLGPPARLRWKSPTEQLWVMSVNNKSTGWFNSSTAFSPAAAIDLNGRILWQGKMKQLFPVEAGQRETVLSQVLAACTNYTDGGAALPGLAYICDGKFIPLDLGDSGLIGEVLRWERLPDGAPGCFIVRS
jgi:N-methylhydantoinase A/oxoprolinase/acetone carboxylase beta subunit